MEVAVVVELTTLEDLEVWGVVQQVPDMINLTHHQQHRILAVEAVVVHPETLAEMEVAAVLV
jgi:hypothetical protein